MFYDKVKKKKKAVSRVLEALQGFRESDYKDSVILKDVATSEEVGKISKKRSKGTDGL